MPSTSRALLSIYTHYDHIVFERISLSSQHCSCSIARCSVVSLSKGTCLMARDILTNAGQRCLRRATAQTLASGCPFKMATSSGSDLALPPPVQAALGRPRFQVVNACTGATIPMGQNSTRVYENTTLEYILLLNPIAHNLQWPVSHIALIVGQVVVKYIHRIARRSKTYILPLMAAKTQLITIQAYRLPRATSFSRIQDVDADDNNFSECLCVFGVCCRKCQVAGSSICSGCGNNGCCRSQNCGHDCCTTDIDVLPIKLDGCPFSGCKQWCLA